MGSSGIEERGGEWRVGEGMRIGLMGGTFDPVHVGHLMLAELARTECALDRVTWFPAGDPPHKRTRPVTPQELRYAMVVLATASHSCFHVSRVELERKGPSYSIDTVEQFRRDCPGAELFFITGADEIEALGTWHRHAELIQQARFIGVSRPGYDIGRLHEKLPESYLERITTLSGLNVDISSTGVRDRVRAGKSIRYMVPEVVEAWIEKHGLYREE
jgi:nicotinate-nucleotide adenylyltransferase